MLNDTLWKLSSRYKLTFQVVTFPNAVLGLIDTSQLTRCVIIISIQYVLGELVQTSPADNDTSKISYFTLLLLSHSCMQIPSVSLLLLNYIFPSLSRCPVSLKGGARGGMSAIGIQ